MGYITYAIIALIVLALIILVSMSYVKAPPNTAYLISGPRKNAKVFTGKAGFRIPFVDRLDKLYLGVIGVDVKTRSAVPTAEYINVQVDANVNVSVGDTPELMAIAAKNFLNQNSDVIADKAQEVLEGNMREIVGQMKLTDMVSNRKLFAQKVLENAVPDMAELGLKIVSFNVQDFKDDKGVINDLGIDNVEQIKKAAAIAKSDAQRDVAIKDAENKRLANEATAKAAIQVAEQNTARDVRQAELKSESEVKRAAADAAYDIQKAAQKKSLDVTEADAEIAKTERLVELQQQQIALTEKKLDAEIRKKADAQLYATQKAAEADLIKRQKDAEAKAYEMEQQARAAKIQAELYADAQRAKAEADLVVAQKEAEGIRAKAEAEAEGIRAKGVAEAEGIDKKAEAQKKMGEASLMEMYFNALPEVVKNAAAPIGNVDKIVMYGDQTGDMMKNVMINTDQIMNSLGEAMGFDVKSALAGALGAKLLGGEPKTE